MNITILGNRLQDLGGFEKNPLQTDIITKIREILSKAIPKKTTLLTSLSPGIEFWAGDIAYELKIPVHVYIPCGNWESKWPNHVKSRYNTIIKDAKKVIKISDSPWNFKLIQQKDTRMIADADVIYSFYNPLPSLITKAAANDKKIIDSLPDNEEYFWSI